MFQFFRVGRSHSGLLFSEETTLFTWSRCAPAELAVTLTLFPTCVLRISGLSMVKTIFFSWLMSTMCLPSFTQRRAQSGSVAVYFPAEARVSAHPESETQPT